MGKLGAVVAVFELPKLLGVVQRVEYGPSPRGCAGGCLYEGVLTAEGCRKGLCVRYRVRVRSRDRRTWEVREFGRVSATDWGGCVSQAVADALWELAAGYEVGVWYEYRYIRAGDPIAYRRKCGVVVNGVRLGQPGCGSVGECVERILEDYRREVERMRGPPPPAPVFGAAEELLREYPELGAFGRRWVGAWAPHARDRLAEIAEVVRRYPWMADVARRGLPDGLNPYEVGAYVARDGSVVCLSLGQLGTYCAWNGTVKAVKLELEFVRHETYEGKRREVYRPRGLLTFSTVGREYVKIL
jgi:hypothetical protein